MSPTHLRPVPTHDRDAAHAAGQGEELAASASATAAHGSHDAARESAAAVSPSANLTTETDVQRKGKALSPLRRECAARASHIVAFAVAAVGAGHVARALQVHRSRVADWADEEHDAAMTLRDVLAVGGEFARIVLTSSLAALDASAPRLHLPPARHALRLHSAVGELSQAIERAEADGVLTHDEVEELLEKLRRIDERAEQFARDLASRARR